MLLFFYFKFMLDFIGVSLYNKKRQLDNGNKCQVSKINSKKGLTIYRSEPIIKAVNLINK